MQEVSGTCSAEFRRLCVASGHMCEEMVWYDFGVGLARAGVFLYRLMNFRLDFSLTPDTSYLPGLCASVDYCF